MESRVTRKLLWAVLFSLSFLAVLLSKVEWTHFTTIINTLDVKFLLTAFFIFLLGNLVRTFRFALLDHTKNRLPRWWNANAFYNFITATLPGGAGEGVTAYVLKKYSHLDLTGALRILLIGRFMDMSSLSFIFFMAAVGIDRQTPYRETAIWLSGMLFVITLMALIPVTERLVVRFLRGLSIRASFMLRVSDKLEELLKMSKEQQSIKIYAVTITQSILSILAGILTLNFLLRSFGIYFSPAQSIYCYGVYAIFQIFPVQGIAGLGTQAAWFALALNAAGYHQNDSVALGFLLHGTFYLFIATMGLVSFLSRSGGER